MVGRVRLEPGRFDLDSAPFLVTRRRAFRLGAVRKRTWRKVGIRFHPLTLRVAFRQGTHGEVKRVRGSQRDEQPTLVRQVGENRHFRAASRPELAAARRPADRDRQTDLCGAHGRRSDTDSSPHKRPEHGEETAIRARDRAVVMTLRVHAREAVE